MEDKKSVFDGGLPPCYRFPEFLAKFQPLVVWPARTMEVAWLNERMRDLASKMPGLSYQSIVAESGLEKFLQMSPDDRVTWARLMCRELGADSPNHPYNTIFYADAGDGGQIYGSLEALRSVGAEGVRAFGPDQAKANECSELVRSISQSIARLRQIAVDPVSVPLWGALDMEVRPQDDDDRVLIGRKDWGFTTVNYTHEGLILDVIAEGEAAACVHTACIGTEDLTMPDEGGDQESSSDTPSAGRPS